MKTDKDYYRQLRQASLEQLWNEEVAQFNQAAPPERIKRVSVIRAVGVAFSANGTRQQKAEVRAWLAGLLGDPAEKVRRYAMAALPKLGAGPQEEAALLALLEKSSGEREQRFLGKALNKIGGTATLQVLSKNQDGLSQTEQKVKASVARRESPSSIRLDNPLTHFAGVRIHLRCRKGLEGILQEEVKEFMARDSRFRLEAVRSRLVVLIPVAPFALAQLYELRCFATIGFVLGNAPSSQQKENVEALAGLITSPLARRLLKTFTQGSLRYRLDFVAKGHQRGAVHLLAQRAYALCPEILNDSRSAPWSMDIYPTGGGSAVELRPRLTPDPRFTYREDDVEAASHPPLAASMARLAGFHPEEAVWDPFCGSGLELIERALRGGVRRVYGTDISPEAIGIAQANFAAARLPGIETHFSACDFREASALPGVAPGSLTLILTNPPMGRRVRVPHLHRLFEDLFDAAARLLKPGGRLIFPNPLRLGPADHSLQRTFQQVVDLGGFDCRLEMYVKRAPAGSPQ